MKKTHLFAVLTALVMAVTMTGCNGLLGDNNTEVYKGISEYCKLEGTVTNYGEIIKALNISNPVINPSARLVAPTVNASGYDFFLYGESGSNICGPYKVLNGIADDATSGKFNVSLPQGAWNLTMVAVKSGDSIVVEDIRDNKLATKVLLMGSAYVDLSGDKTSAKFILSPEGLTLPGHVNLSVILDGWKLSSHSDATDPLKGMEVTAELYDLKTGKGIKEGDNANYTKVILEAFAAGDGSTEAKDGALIGTDDYTTYAVGTEPDLTDIQPGTYNLVINFQNADGDVNWQWSDKLMVFPGKTTDQSVYISEIIKEAPKAPEYLFASILEGNTADALLDPVIDNDGMKNAVIFDWADWSEDGFFIENEVNFELQVADISNVAGKYATGFSLEQPTNPTATNPVFWTKDAENNDIVKYIEVDDVNTVSSITKTDALRDGKVTTYSIDVTNDKATHYSGSLLANNKQLVINLVMGKEYTARIRAVNKAGKSAWTYVSLTDGEYHKDGVTAGSTPGSTETVSPSGTKYEGTTINTFAIRYWLNGGNTAIPIATENYVEYGPKKYTTENKTGLKYWDAFGEGLKKASVNISGWKVGPSSTASSHAISNASAADIITYDGFTTDLTSSSEKKFADAGYKAKCVRHTTSTNTDGIKTTINQDLYTKETVIEAPENTTAEDTYKWKKAYGAKATVDYASAELNFYEGYENLNLYAAYESEFEWQMVTEYEFKAKNIKYEIGSINADGDFEAKEDGALTGDKAVKATHDPKKGNYIRWAITTPGTEWNYRFVKVTIKSVENNAECIAREEVTDVAEPGNPTYVITDVTGCRTGVSYMVSIEVGLPNSSLAATVPVILDVL